MIKRTLVFTKACYLGMKHGQIRYCPKEDGEEERIVPLEDVGFVVLESPAITISTRLLNQLNQNKTAVLLCDETHMPAAMLQNLDGHSTHAETLGHQLNASLPLKKRLWQQLVKAKISNQADLLETLGRQGSKKLRHLANQVKSGDSDNREGVAARVYWSELFLNPDFTRDREGEPPNHLLNYGYAILRAATARALMSSGLLCALGLHHQNRYNAFALTDDVMEPYRPFVDQIVVETVSHGVETEPLDPSLKQSLLGVLTMDTRIRGVRSPLMVALSTTTASLARCFMKKEQTVQLPSLL